MRGRAGGQGEHSTGVAARTRADVLMGLRSGHKLHGAQLRRVSREAARPV